MAAVRDIIEDSVYLDLLPLLRQRTRDAHDRLDAALDFRTPGTVTLSRYAALLRATLGVVAPLELALAEWLPAPPGRTRTSCLQADLYALGQAESHLPVAVRLPRTLAEAYGCAYVVEGSSLGGLVVASLVTRDLGGDTPVSYLTLRGRDTRPAWHAFLERLGAFAAGCSAQDSEAAAMIAVDTFNAYAASFRRAGIVPQFA
jgi:heme oxygenase